MKVLSLLQPWASLVALGQKKIETRSWNTKYRGELLIHASKKKPTDPMLYDAIHDIATNAGLIRNWSELPYGAIIGKVNLVDTISTNHVKDIFLGLFADEIEFYTHNGLPSHLYNYLKLTRQEHAFGDYSPNRFGWKLSDPVLFEKPIPAKGQLGIWNLPVDLEGIVNEQISIATR